MQVHTWYHTAKGSEISVYCRVCTKPSSPSYLKKGMLPRLQGTIKLKAVSRLFGRMPRMQGRSAWAERPVCRHISATLLTLHLRRECTGRSKHLLPTTWEKTLHMDITRWSISKADWLYSISFAAKDGEALYSQQKQDRELTVAQIMNTLLANSDLRRK